MSEMKVDSNRLCNLYWRLYDMQAEILHINNKLAELKNDLYDLISEDEKDAK